MPKLALLLLIFSFSVCLILFGIARQGLKGFPLLKVIAFIELVSAQVQVLVWPRLRFGERHVFQQFWR
jgi:hypothetical protein